MQILGRYLVALHKPLGIELLGSKENFKDLVTTVLGNPLESKDKSTFLGTSRNKNLIKSHFSVFINTVMLGLISYQHVTYV